MSHLRIGIVGEIRPSAALLAHLMMNARCDDVFIISLRHEPRTMDAGALALDIIRADIPRIEMRALAEERVTIPEMSLEMACKALELCEEFILPEREPLPRAPKSILPKTGLRLRPITRKGALRNR